MRNPLKKLIKRILTGIFAAALAITLLGGVAACYQPDTGFQKVDPGKLPDPDPNKDYKALGMERYDEPVTITVAAIEYPLEPDVKPGTSPHTQSFNRIAKEVLNIDLQYTVMSSSSYYDTQLNLAIGANRTPDMFYTTNGTMFASLKKNGKLADLGEIFYYLNEDLQEIYTDFMPELLPNVMEKGKLYAFPMASNKYESASRLYVRKDWLDKVGMQAPATVEELIAVGEAFLANKSQLAGDRTIPLVANKEITWAGSTSLMGLFQSHGASPNAYFKGENGKLYASNTSPQMKDALATMRTLYEKKILDQEFISKNVDMVYGNIASGQAGMVFGEWWLPNGKVGDAVVNVDGADWVGVDLPVFSDQAHALPVVKRVNLTGYNVVSSACRHPDAIAKLINLFYDIYYNDDAEQIYGKDVLPSNGFYYNFVPVKLWNSVASIEEYKRVRQVFSDAYDAGMRGDWTELSESQAAALTGEAKATYERQLEIYDRLKAREKKLHFTDGYPYYCAVRAGKTVAQMTKKERAGWSIYNCMIAPDGGYAYVTALTEGKKQAAYDEFYGTPTTVMVEKGDSLNSYTQTTFTQIITGQQPLDFFDEYVAAYNRAGGSDLITQVNAWYDVQWKQE